MLHRRVACEPDSLIGPAVVAAGIAGIVSVITLVMNRATTLTTHSQRLAVEREQAERKSSADIALAQQKLGLDREFAGLETADGICRGGEERPALPGRHRAASLLAR